MKIWCEDMKLIQVTQNMVQFQIAVKIKVL